MRVAAAAASLVFTAGCIGCLLSLHLTPIEGYSPIEKTVSEYGLTPRAAWYRAQVRLAAAGAALLALALRHPARVVVCLLVFAAARAAISFFPIIGAAGRRSGGRWRRPSSCCSSGGAPACGLGAASPSACST